MDNTILGSIREMGIATGFSEEENGATLDERIADAPFEALMEACFSSDELMGDDDLDSDWMNEDDPFADDDSLDSISDESDPFADDETDELSAESITENLFRTLEVESDEAEAVCPGCSATWEQIALDERAGCSRCYATFRASLLKLIEQVQRESQHVGKTPRAAFKRRLRLEHLRQRRDNQLTMLRNRLADAVRGERYEEAATLRDKIKVVSSSLF
ncbi:protein-arginine kinase activator protein [Abditibacteriota bacterium]|nr:protein-arginine kinase activator protein [Abditibacteriota bacterium]